MKDKKIPDKNLIKMMDKFLKKVDKSNTITAIENYVEMQKFYDEFFKQQEQNEEKSVQIHKESLTLRFIALRCTILAMDNEFYHLHSEWFSRH